MKYKYVRAHPESSIGRNLTEARKDGWVLVTYRYIPQYNLSYPIFRESFYRWFKRVVLRKKCYLSGD